MSLEDDRERNHKQSNEPLKAQDDLFCEDQRDPSQRFDIIMSYLGKNSGDLKISKGLGFQGGYLEVFICSLEVQGRHQKRSGSQIRK